MGWEAFAIAFVGALIMSANRWLKDADTLTARFPLIKPRGWWDHIPLALFIVAGLVWGVGRLLPSVIVPSRPVTATVGEMPLDEIMAVFDGRTDAEAKRILETYSGHRATVEGVVGNVTATTTIPEETPSVLVSLDRGFDYGISMWFEDGEQEAATSFRQGERIRAQCRFEADRANSSSVNFADCRLTAGPFPAE